MKHITSSGLSQAVRSLACPSCFFLAGVAGISVRRESSSAKEVGKLSLGADRQANLASLSYAKSWSWVVLPFGLMHLVPPAPWQGALHPGIRPSVHVPPTHVPFVQRVSVS